jgi:hypothetical protein
MAMFEKKGRPVLMRDRGTRRRVSSGKYGKKQDNIYDRGEEKNEGKPYAGEGGMKKLLTRRKMEVTGVVEKEMKDASVVTEPEHALRPHTPPSPPKSKVAPQANGHGYEPSSLRVGRSKANKHKHAPSAKVPMKSGNRFSAIYEEGGVEDEDEEERRRERVELEDAAKKVPEFKIPDGFSFAKAEVRYFEFSGNQLLSDYRHRLRFHLFSILNLEKARTHKLRNRPSHPQVVSFLLPSPQTPPSHHRHPTISPPQNLRNLLIVLQAFPISLQIRHFCVNPLRPPVWVLAVFGHHRPFCLRSRM